ncbi:hypothetical protein FUT40_23370 [Escherichia coli]|nr:hypothetical protein [Escherichia coli]
MILMVPIIGVEPTTFALRIIRIHFLFKALPHQHCAHTSHHIKTCKALQAIARPYVSQFCPTLYYDLHSQ